MENKNLAERILEANCILPADVLFFLKKAKRTETSKKGKKFLEMVFENIAVAGEKKFPLCQDTGIVSFYVPHKYGGEFLRRQTFLAYKELRNSQVDRPFDGKVDKRNLPDIHYSDGSGKGKFIVRGGGSLNCTALIMANPSSTGDEIIRLVADSVAEKAPYCCPPVFVGIGLGGTPSGALLLSEEILTQDLRGRSTKTEKKILTEINKSGIGPGGWGGKNTALCVKIKELPSHMATLSVGITISCWCLRKGNVYG
ncbi:MAG: fumarate hydratase [bacterium]